MALLALIAAFTDHVAAAVAAHGPGAGLQNLAFLGTAVVAAQVVHQPVPRAARAPPAPPLVPAPLVSRLGFLPVRISRELTNVYAVVTFLSALMTMTPLPSMTSLQSVRALARARVVARAAIALAGAPLPTIWDLLWEAVDAIAVPQPAAAAAVAPAVAAPALGAAREARALAALRALLVALPQPVGAGTLGTVVAALLVSPGAPAELDYLRGSSVEIAAAHGPGGGAAVACGAPAVVANMRVGAGLLVESRPGDGSFGVGVVRALRSGEFLRLRLPAGAPGPAPRNPACGCPIALGGWEETARIIAPPPALVAVQKRPLVLFEVARGDQPHPIRVGLGGAYTVAGETLIDGLEARLVAALVTLGGP